MSALHLPEVCGVMLLPDCTLFPHGGLPLHIFEPRYRQMLAESLASSCFFAVARCLGEETADPSFCAAPIGTIGLVRASREMDDGTSNLLLHGVIRVRFTEWLEGTAYPRARITPIPSVFEPAAQGPAALEALAEAADTATRDLAPEIRGTVMEMVRKVDDPSILADVIAQQFVHDPDDRQHLLENDSAAARIAWLCRQLAG